MTARENRPTGAASEAGGLGSSIPQNAEPRSESALIGSTVEKVLDSTLWRLRAGEITLNDLTPALQGFYVTGHADGRASLQPELERAISERDRYYRAAFDPRTPIISGPSYAELEKIRAEIYGGAK